MSDRTVLLITRIGSEFTSPQGEELGRVEDVKVAFVSPVITNLSVRQPTIPAQERDMMLMEYFDSCGRAVERIESRFGPVDTLVNNAGILTTNKIADTTPEEWRKIFSTGRIIDQNGGFQFD